MSTARAAQAAAAAAAMMLTLTGCPRTGRISSGTPTALPSGRQAVVVVDGGHPVGRFNNPARFHNQADHSLALRPGHERLVRALDPLVARVWVNPRRYYDATTGRYTYDYPSVNENTAYRYLDQVAQYADQMMVNINQCHQIFMVLAASDACRRILKDGLRHYKQRYPELRYVELFNEPDRVWDAEPDEPQPMPVDQYYRWYQIGYAIVNELNAELDPEVPLAIGGPVSYTFNRPYLERFIALYATDPNPAKRLDFIAYHQYHARGNPAAVATEKATVQDWLTAHRLPSTTPVFVTEYGVFPGMNTGTTFEADVLVQAAAMAALGYYYATSGIDMVMHWVFDHPTNDRKSMFVDGTEDAVYPYYNLVAMQRMLLPTLVRTESDSLSPEGLGVHALGTTDRASLAVLVGNYQWTRSGPALNVTVSVKNLPTEFTGRRIRVERYLVDGSTSNYVHDPTRSRLERVDRYLVDRTVADLAAFPMFPNAMSLLILTPVQ